MRRFEAGSESGFRLHFTSADEGLGDYDPGETDSIGPASSAGGGKITKSSEPVAVAKALGIAIGLIVLYIVLREYGGGVA